MLMNDKAALRRAIRAMFPGREERRRQSSLLCRRILESDMYKRARVVGGYMPLAREADITPILLDALRTGRTLALPLCGDAPRMTLRQVKRLEELVPGAYGIPEPREDAPIIGAEKLDLLLVPLEGIDRSGMRLGKGGGYYDCLLQAVSVPTLGCALLHQWACGMPSEPWDRPLDACVDADGIYLFHHDTDFGKKVLTDGNPEEKEEAADSEGHQALHDR